MGALLPILLALNIVAASVATPTLVSGLGLGSGAAGSSFKQEVKKSSLSDVKAATTIFKLSCDQEIWNKNKANEEPAYPQSDTDFKNLFDQAEKIGMNRFNELCQAHNEGNSGIVFADPATGERDNGVEMFHLFSSHWDKRSLTAIYYLYQKRFTDKGYAVDCSNEGKTSPIMTLAVAGGYVDENGQPTALAQSGIEDDKEASSSSQQAFSPHSRGQAVDVKTFGCTIITGEEPNVFANNLALGQDDDTQMSDFSAQALASVVHASGQASADVQEGLAESKANNSTFVTAGLDAGERAGIGAVEVAADISDPDAQPEIMPVDDPPADLEIASAGATIPDYSAKKNKNQTSFEDKAAQMLERSYEKQQSLPAGSLSDGSNLETFGRKALYDQTGIALSKKPTADEMAAAAATLAAHQNPQVAALVPAQAINNLKSGNYEAAFKTIGANRINVQFSLGFSDSQVAGMAQSGVSGDDFVTYLGNQRRLSEDEAEYMRALSNGGYKGLKNKLDAVQAQRDQSVSGQFLKILKDSPILTAAQRSAINDFLSNKSYRTGVARRLQGDNAPQSLIDWVNNNQNISDQDAKDCLEILTTYTSSSDPKNALDNAYPSVHATVALSSTSLMSNEEKLIFQGVFGSNPTTKDLKEGFSNGKFEQAGEAYMFSKGLQRIGISSAQSSYLGIGLAQDRLSSTDVGLARINREIGKKWNVTLSKDDLTLFKNGNFSGGKKLAIGAVASKSKLPVQKAVDYFTKKDNNDNETGKAIAKAYKPTSQGSDKTTAMLNSMTTKDTNQDKNVAAATSSAGAKAKAKAIANSSAEGATTDEANNNRQSTSDKLEKAFDSALDKGETAAKQKGRDVLTSKGLNNQEADAILDGKVQGSEKTVANSVVAKKIVEELPPGTVTVEGVKSVLNGKSTPEQRDALKDNLVTYELAQNHIYYTGSRSISDIMENGPAAERQALMSDLGKQYGAYVVQTSAQDAGVSLTREQSLEFMNRDFSSLGDVAGQTALATGISRITGTQVSGEAASAIYSSLQDAIHDSPAPTTSVPSASADQAPQGVNSGESPNSAANASANASQEEAPQGVSTGESPNSAANASANTTDSSASLTPADKVENLGWGLAEDKLGFSRETITNLDENIKNLPDNITNYYTNFNYTAALTSIATGVILNKLIGNTLAKIDPTGGLLSSYVMCHAAAWVATLGISMPILLGISLLIDFKGTIQAIKGLITMAFQIFTDPIGFISGLLGFGKKTPKAKPAAKNAAKAMKNDTLDGEIVDAPIDTQMDANTGVAQTRMGNIAYAAEDSETGAEQVLATSKYLASKKPSEEQFKKISRRTVDQVVEDLLLFSLAASDNDEATKDPDFLKRHWSNFMDIENPKNSTYAIKQLVSPRAVISADEVAAAKKLDITDALYAEESSEQSIGYKQIVNYARMLFGDDFLPSNVSQRVSGLMQNRSIKTHVHFAF